MVAQRAHAGPPRSRPWVVPVERVGHSRGIAEVRQEVPAFRRAGGRRVLVIDDEPAIVDLLASLLEDEGWTVLPAAGPAEAWRIASAVPLDAILCDVSMPRMSGIELMRRMRAADLIDGTPVVLMSAAAREADAEGAVFLPKPFDLDDVVDLLDRLVAG